MKVYLSILMALLTATLLSACAKKPTINNTVTEPAWQLKQWDSLKIPVALKEKENLTITSAYLEGFPYHPYRLIDGGVSLPLNGNTSMRNMHIYTSNADTGTYDIKLVTVYDYDLSANLDIQQIKISVTPSPAEDCQHHFFSSIKGSKHMGDLPITNRSPSSKYHTIVKQGKQLYLNRIPIDYWTTQPLPTDTRTFSPEDILISITIDCDHESIIIPKQAINAGNKSYEIVGGGSIDFTRWHYTINYTSNGQQFTVKGF